MPRTVDTSSTLENFRVEHNNLANDIGSIGNLTTGDTSSVVNAINYIMDQYFFFQDFDFDGSDGATSNTVFSGADNSSNTLQYSAGKLLVYKNGLLLRNGTDYTATNGTSVVLGSSASNSDVIRISSYTGSYQNVNSDSSAAFDAWQQAGGVIFNKNTGGIVFNADSSITTTPTVSNSFQFDGPSYHNDHVHVNAVSSSPKELRFRDADNSNYVALLAPTTVGTNFSLKLPTADGSADQFLKTNGSGQLSFATVASTAPDFTVSAQNSENSTHFPVFVDGATGAQAAETDSGLTYNPSTGRITSTEYSGNIISATQNSITTMTALNHVGTIGNGTWQGTAIARAYIANDAINADKIDDNAVGAAALNVSGNGSSGNILASDGDGSFSWTTDGGLTTEAVQDITGAMFSSNTETGISATYEDGDGTIDLVIGSDVIVQSMIADNAIDSQHYVDGSIDSEHIADDAIHAGKMAISNGNGSSGQVLASDGDGTFSWAADSGLSTEQVQDIVGGMLVGTETRIGVTYDDAAGRINFVVDDMTANDNTQLSTEAVQDIVGGMLVGTETRIGVTYDDAAGRINFVVDDMTANDNTQLSTADVRGKISGTGLISYNNSTGVISTSATSSTGTVGTSGSPVDNDFAKFTDANTIEGRSYSEVRTDLGLATSATTDTTNADNIGSGTLAAARVATLNQNTTGRSNEVLVNSLGTDDEYNVLFHIGSNTIGQDSGTDAFTYNPNSNLLHTAGAITAGGDITAFLSSDVAFKENISPISQALEKVGLISGYEFDWKDHKDPQVLGKGHDVGIIAQEVEKVLPEVVTTRENGKKAVNYQKIIPLLIESIKELKSELDDLKSSNS